MRDYFFCLFDILRYVTVLREMIRGLKRDQLGYPIINMFLYNVVGNDKFPNVF